MLRETENLEEQGDILVYLVDTQGLDYNTGNFTCGYYFDFHCLSFCLWKTEKKNQKICLKPYVMLIACQVQISIEKVPHISMNSHICSYFFMKLIEYQIIE